VKPKRPPRNIGLCLVIPDGVVFADRLDGETVIRCRTERQVPVPGRRLTPTPA
jgi:hypothetical protein